MNLTVTRNSISVSLLTFLLAIAMASCGTTKHTARSSTSKNKTEKTDERRRAPKRVTTEPRRHLDLASYNDNTVTSRLLTEADSWIGTPYVWGGNDRNGVDCSGFVTQVYLRSLEIKLPRTSEQQQQFCRSINKTDLRPGDLVFFTVRGGDRVGHVGIYIGDGQMVHSSSSKGVIITPLDNPYFVANYHSAGRVERYYALMDKPAKKPSEKKETVKEPMLAQKPAAKPTQKPSAKPAAKSESKPASKKKENKIEPKPAEQPVFATPLPSQVFASKEKDNKSRQLPAAPATPDNEPDEEPDFFD